MPESFFCEHHIRNMHNRIPHRQIISAEIGFFKSPAGLPSTYPEARNQAVSRVEKVQTFSPIAERFLRQIQDSIIEV